MNRKKYSVHTYRTDDAMNYGLREAVLLSNIRHWLDKNKANGTNVYDGRYWTYNSHTAFAELFYYMSLKQIKTSLQKLIKAGILLTGNYNKLAYDRTTWYSVNEPEYVTDAQDDMVPTIEPNGTIHEPIWDHPSDQTGSPIPNRNPDSKPNSKPHLNGTDEFDEIIKYWNKCHNTDIRPTDNKKKQYLSRLKTFTVEEIKRAIRNRSESDYIRGDGINHASNWPSLFRNDDQIDKYLNMRRSTDKAPEVERELPKYTPSFSWFDAGGK